MAALIDKVGSNRSAHTRPPATKELAATAILRLPLVEVSVKVRAGGVADDTADLQTPAWAGVIPLKLMPGLPEPADSVRVPLPDYLRLDRGPWYQPARMAGRLVSLEPLDASHTDDLFAALDHEDVWRHLPRRRPTTVGDYRQIVQAGLAAMYRGERVIWVQRSTVTGEVIGTTAYYDIDPANRWLAIGWTQLGRSWWGTGVNAQAKLLLLSRAFEELGAVRVAWHTDVRNERSRAAITALGAVPEGMLRYHKRRTDGSWRDTMLYSMTCDEWPAAKERLVQRYSAASP
jgi:RimJ/RimL family protein N-acetyltransferase